MRPELVNGSSPELVGSPVGRQAALVAAVAERCVGYEPTGGGGAGGVIYNATYPVIPDTTYPVTVGLGGTGTSSGGLRNCCQTDQLTAKIVYLEY
jgi:hypothetical protein